MTDDMVMNTIGQVQGQELPLLLSYKLPTEGYRKKFIITMTLLVVY